MNFISQGIYEILVTLFNLTGNLGFSIILLTIVVRSLLVPLSVPSMRKQAKNREKLKAIKPEIDKLKLLHKNDKAKLSQAQLELYKKHDIQLFSISMILPFVQLFFLFALYQVLINFLKTPEIAEEAFFFGINLVEKDRTYVLPALAVITQLFMSVQLLPGIETHDVVPNDSKSKKVQKANAAETDTQEMAESIQQQMLFILPIMTGFFAASFPGGVALYWVVTTVFSIVQQYFISGMGGVGKYWLKLTAMRK